MKSNKLLLLVLYWFMLTKSSLSNATCDLVSPGSNLENNFLVTQGERAAQCKEPISVCWAIHSLALHEPWIIHRINLSNLCASRCVSWVEQIKYFV